jgi:hypothetical protein
MASLAFGFSFRIRRFSSVGRQSTRRRIGRPRSAAKIPCYPLENPCSSEKLPDDLLREFTEKSVRHSGLGSIILALRPEIVIFPVKFPVCREFGLRPVRPALRRQPGTHLSEIPKEYPPGFVSGACRLKSALESRRG